MSHRPVAPTTEVVFPSGNNGEKEQRRMNLLPSGPTRENHDATHSSLHGDDDAGVLDDPPTISFREDDHDCAGSTSSRKRARVDAGADSRTNSDSVAASSSREELSSPDDDMTAPTPVVVVQPREDDILLGRGRKCINYIGNQRFRDLVRSRKDEYATSLSHGCDSSKDDIVRDILQEIARRGGRFLQRVVESSPTTAVDAQERGDRAMAKRSPTKKKNSNDQQTVLLYQIVDLKGALTKIKQTLRDREYVRPADRGNGGRGIQPPPPPLWPTASDHPPWLSSPVPISIAAAQKMADPNDTHSTGGVLHRPVAAVPTAHGGGVVMGGGTTIMLDRPQDDCRHGFQLLQMLLHQQQQQRRDVEMVRAQQLLLLHDIVLRQLLQPHQQQSHNSRHSSPDDASWRQLASQQHHDDSFFVAPLPVPLLRPGTLLTPPYHSTAASLLPNGSPPLLHEAARNNSLRSPVPATPPHTVLADVASPLLPGRPMPVPPPLMLAGLSFYLQQQHLLSLYSIPPAAAAAAVATTSSTTTAAFWGNNNSSSSFMRTTTTTNSPNNIPDDHDHHHKCQQGGDAHHHDQHDSDDDDDDDDDDDSSFLFTRIRP
jgi:hypothetical protein